VFGLIGVVVGVAATEAVGAALTGSVPTLPTHVAAVAIALLSGYGVAVTVAFSALLTGLVESMEWVVGEVERLAGGVVHEAEAVLHLPERAGPAAPGATVSARVGSVSGPSGRSSGGMIGGIQDEP
jgi:hypothetical protein